MRRRAALVKQARLRPVPLRLHQAAPQLVLSPLPPAPLPGQQFPLLAAAGSAVAAAATSACPALPVMRLRTQEAATALQLAARVATALAAVAGLTVVAWELASALIQVILSSRKRRRPLPSLPLLHLALEARREPLGPLTALLLGPLAQARVLAPLGLLTHTPSPSTTRRMRRAMSQRRGH